MKKFGIALLTMGLAANCFAHGGGNGGDDLEIALKKKALQIGFFIKSETGTKTFRSVNADTFIETVNSLDIDVTTEDVVEKHGYLRTCVNEPEKKLITCNADKINALNSKQDILTATLFHEILGLMELELGYEENVSMYPISSKILAYSDIIDRTPVTDKQIRPEFFSTESPSYGLKIINRKTQESVRMICLNNNIEINRCRNYAVVKNSKQYQSPLIPEVISLSPEQLKNIQLHSVDVVELENKLHELNRNGFKYIHVGNENSLTTFKFSKNGGNTKYRYGVGALQACANNPFLSFRDDCYLMTTLPLLVPITGMFIADTVTEAGKQVGLIVTYPFKALINGIRAGILRGEIAKMNKRIETARDVLNLDNDLSLIDKSQKVSDEEYKQLINILTTSINNQQQAKAQ